MPTYKSRGVHGTLLLADLASTLSSTLTSRVGEGRRPHNLNAIENALAGGTVMPDYPIGADGGEQGVVQFIGPNEDMPYFAVEVAHPRQRRPWPPPRSKRPSDAQQQDQQPLQPPMPPSIVSEAENTRSKQGLESAQSSPLSELSSSSLSSHGAMSPSIEPAHVGHTASQTRESSHLEDAPGVESESSLLSHSAYSKPQDWLTNPMALVLEIKANMGEYQNTTDPKIATDTKVEVWLNGCLVHVSFIARIRSGPACHLHLSGKRTGDVAEKPWVYQEADRVGSSPFTAQQRWNTTNKTLDKQASTRGIDKFGKPPPSAQYLHVLSQSTLPARLRDRANLAILDVVITTGLGHKLADPWKTRPIPMISNLFKVGGGNNDRDTTSRSTTDRPNEHTPQPDADSGVDVSTDQSLIKSTPKRQKLETTPSKLDSTKGIKRRSSRRVAGEVLVLPKDYFLQTPGENKDVRQARPPRKVAEAIHPAQPIVTEVAEPLEIPNMCEGSVISYAGADAQRLIPQSRPARFDENGLVVGFRFVVV